MNWWEALGVDRKATWTEIEEAFRKAKNEAPSRNSRKTDQRQKEVNQAMNEAVAERVKP